MHARGRVHRAEVAAIDSGARHHEEEPLKGMVFVLAFIGVLAVAALVNGCMEANLIEWERTHDCGYVPSSGMYRCNGGR